MPPVYPFVVPSRYYGLPAWLAVTLATGLLLTGLALWLPVLRLADDNGWYHLLILAFLPLLTLLSTPFLRVIGSYKYYSPLFLVFGETATRFEVHSGPSLDYLLHLRGVPAGDPLKRTVLAFYLQGLLNIAAKIETLDDPAAVEVVGTSYFFTDRSVERMGFTVAPAGWFHRINLIVNFPELALLNSLAAGRLDLPNVLKVKKATMTGQRLLEHRDYIRRLYERMATERNRGYEREAVGGGAAGAGEVY